MKYLLLFFLLVSIFEVKAQEKVFSDLTSFIEITSSEGQYLNRHHPNTEFLYAFYLDTAKCEFTFPELQTGKRYFLFMDAVSAHKRVNTFFRDSCFLFIGDTLISNLYKEHFFDVLPFTYSENKSVKFIIKRNLKYRNLYYRIRVYIKNDD